MACKYFTSYYADNVHDISDREKYTLKPKYQNFNLIFIFKLILDQ